MSDPWWQLEGPAQGPLVIFAHGAGAGPQSEFMQSMAANLVAEDIAVLRFEFPYWTQVRQTGKRRPPNPQPSLQARMEEVVAQLEHPHDERPIWLMGKSMGARVAFQMADRLNAVGAIGLGFPFHPPGKMETTRNHELVNQRRHNLVVQGTHDPFGKYDWVMQQALPDNLNLHWVDSANHDLVPKKAAQLSAEESWHLVALHVAHFIKDEEWRLSLFQ